MRNKKRRFLLSEMANDGFISMLYQILIIRVIRCVGVLENGDAICISKTKKK